MRDTLRIVAERYGRFDMEEAYRLCRVFGIGTEKRIFSLSTGQNTLLKLVYGLAVDCPYKFFDEPVLGLDPINKELFYRELLKSYERRPVSYTHLDVYKRQAVNQLEALSSASGKGAFREILKMSRPFGISVEDAVWKREKNLVPAWGLS